MPITSNEPPGSGEPHTSESTSMNKRQVAVPSLIWIVELAEHDVGQAAPPTRCTLLIRISLPSLYSGNESGEEMKSVLFTWRQVSTRGSMLAKCPVERSE